MDHSKKDPKKIKFCETCQKEFSLVRIRHSCKRCYRTVCSDCGKARVIIPTYDETKPHKICIICEKEHRFQTEFIAINRPSWGKLCNAAKKWASTCQPKKAVARSQSESYAHYLALARHPTTKFDDFKIIDRDVLEGRSNRSTFNYSLQDFLFPNQKGVDEQKLKEMTSNVLKAYCMKFPTFGYTQGMSYITVFLLSLMDEESAFWMLGYIVSNVLPDNFYAPSRQGIPLMGYQQEKYVIGELAKEILNLDEDVADNVQTFLEINGPALLVPLFVSYLNFELLYETWNQMLMTRSFMICRKIVIKIIQILLPTITKRGLINPPEAQNQITMKFNREEFKQAQKIEISEARVKELGEKFKMDFSSQWMSNQSHIYYTLQKVTHFSKKEIVELQEEFNKYLEPSASPPEDNVNTEESASSGLLKYGIKKEDFKKIMTEVVSKDEDNKEFLKTFDLDQMFKVFDADKTETIDFKEFLLLLSMLMRGKIEERVEFAFQVFDMGGKGYLTPQEYEQFLKSIVQAIVVSHRGNLNPFFKDDLKKFEDSMMQIVNKTEEITFMDIYKNMMTHEFVKYCDVSAEVFRRGETITKIKSSLAENPKILAKSSSFNINENVLEPVPEKWKPNDGNKFSEFEETRNRTSSTVLLSDLDEALAKRRVRLSEHRLDYRVEVGDYLEVKKTQNKNKILEVKHEAPIQQGKEDSAIEVASTEQAKEDNNLGIEEKALAFEQEEAKKEKVVEIEDNHTSNDELNKESETTENNIKNVNEEVSGDHQEKAEKHDIQGSKIILTGIKEAQNNKVVKAQVNSNLKKVEQERNRECNLCNLF